MSVPHVALLRGINVGGNNKIPMKDLTNIFVEAGAENVRTYIQSGNVLFAAPARISSQIPDNVSKLISDRFAFQTTVLLRSEKQLRDIVAYNPFLEAGAYEETLHVLFLAGKPGTDRVKELDPDRSRPDAFAVRGQEIFLHLPNGVARTKLTNTYFDSNLETTSTGRNWRTVTKLLDLMGV
jgi:uncharacterized protein (DUF1697 family)